MQVGWGRGVTIGRDGAGGNAGSKWRGFMQERGDPVCLDGMVLAAIRSDVVEALRELQTGLGTGRRRPAETNGREGGRTCMSYRKRSGNCGWASVGGGPSCASKKKGSWA